LDQPFVFELRSRKAEYQIECYDTSSPENWRLLQPQVIVLCYDISQRLSLINLQRIVSVLVPRGGSQSREPRNANSTGSG